MIWYVPLSRRSKVRILFLHLKPLVFQGFFFSVFLYYCFDYFYNHILVHFTTFHEQITNMKIEVKLITKRSEKVEGFPLIIEISHRTFVK
jgi:hypothetical protein